MTTSTTRAAALCALLATTCLSAPAFAQSAGELPQPPVRQAIDENGVDVIRGGFPIAQTDVSIGPNDRRGLAFTRYTTSASTDFSNTMLATIEVQGGTHIVTVDGVSDSFTSSGSAFVSTEGNGATLTLAGGIYTYVSRDGTRARFASNAGYNYSFYEGELARLGGVTYPDGTGVTYSFKVQTLCPGGYEGGLCMSELFYVSRLQGVTNSNGYGLKFTYASNAATLSDVNYDAWKQLTSVKAFNLASEYCDRAADSCTLTGNWPTATFSETVDATTGHSVTNVTDPLGRVTRYTADTAFRVKRPGATSDNLVVTSGAGGVATVVNDGVTHSYSYSTSGTTRTTTVTDSNGGTRVYVGDTATNLLSSFKDELNRTTSYAYDTNGRLTEIIYPEGNKARYTYDARGNVIETRLISKTPGTPADIVTSAVFPATCTNPTSCNKPTSTTDARGNVTDYTYDATHGGLLTATAPAPTAGAVRPQTRVTYSALQAFFKISSTGAPVGSGAFTLPTAISACQTLASCAGTADEVRTNISYGPQTAGVANNLLPASVSSGAGDGSLTATNAVTYDMIGNVLTVDGPLAGTADTARARYDAGRQLVGAVSPDPDGTGALNHRAQRTTYNLDGQPTKVERGTVAGTSDAQWAAFAPLETGNVTYDANARPVKQTLEAGGTIHALAQTSYDALGRPECSAQRMNPTVFATITTGACSLGTAGSFGPDRIAKTVYDAAGQVTQVQTGVGVTGVAANEVTTTYTNNGQAATLTDAEGNRTTYDYDGHGRLLTTRFPSPTTDGVSSTTDYEQLTYDAGSNVTQRRIRDGQNLFYSYDNLSRLTFYDSPNYAISELDRTYAYDNLGRLKSVFWDDMIEFTYDALGRRTSESDDHGLRSSAYDLAGRRTRITHPDGFYVDHDYLVTGEMKTIRENGATSGAGVLATFLYDDLGRRTSLTRGNGTVTGYAYDAASRLSQLTQDLAGTTHDLTLGFTYNPAHQIVSNTRSNDTYAWAGHGTGTTSSTVNGLNQLTAHGGTTITHDGRGNVASIGSQTYGLTAENWLSGSNGYNYHYDGLQRMRMVNQTSWASYRMLAYDGADMFLEYDAQTISRRYVHGPGVDEPLVWYEGSGTTTRRWLHADERGSIVAVSDAAGAAIGINRYDEYGAPASTNIGTFQYTGQLWVPELGMYNYRARTYDPGLGRFVQADPIGYASGMNLYAYVGGDPVNFTDPSGMKGQRPNPHVVPLNPNEAVVKGDVCRARNCNFKSAPGPAPGNGGGDSGRGGGGSGSEQGEEIVITGTRPKRISRCMQNFLAAQGYGTPFLNDIRFIRGMNDDGVASIAQMLGHGAITLGRHIYVTPSRWDSITDPSAGPTYFEEVVHSLQWHMSGSFGFIFSYALGAVSVGLGGGDPHNNHVEAQAMGASQTLYRNYMNSQNQRCE